LRKEILAVILQSILIVLRSQNYLLTTTQTTRIIDNNDNLNNFRANQLPGATGGLILTTRGNRTPTDDI
jgi:hypothetical protein